MSDVNADGIVHGHFSLETTSTIQADVKPKSFPAVFLNKKNSSLRVVCTPHIDCEVRPRPS